MRKYCLAVMLLSLFCAAWAAGSEEPRQWYQPDRAHWVDRGLIIEGASHEPLIFRIRRGGWLGDLEAARRQWLAEHEPQRVQELVELGVELFHSHGYKGFGYEAEKEDMRLLAGLSKAVHQAGLRLCTYSQVMTLVPETFYAEVPAAKDWIQRQADGTPIMLSYDYQHSYRPKPSLAHPDYRKYYQEKILRTLVRDCDSDMLHFDNFDCNMEPESDQSPAAVRAFHDYLRGKYTRERLIERFGHANVDLIDPPLWNQYHDPHRIGVILDPAQQEWIDFRCWLMADWLREMRAYARTLKPDIAIEVNPHGLFGTNRAFQAALWHPWFMRYTEAIWSEEPNHADYDDRGVLISRIRSYKMCRTLDNIAFTYNDNDRTLAENLAFNQTMQYVGIGSGPSAGGEANSKYLEFYKKHREVYTLTRNRADVAILRSYPSMAYDNHRAELEQCMFEQALIQSHVPFDIIFDEQLDRLDRYRVLVLAGQHNLSDATIERIERFVAGGGGLVVTGLTGSRDEWVRRRAEPGLARLLGIDRFWVPGRLEGRAFSEQPRSAQGGRVIYLPEIIPPDREQAENWLGSWDGNVGRGNWILPANHGELAAAVRRAAGGAFSLEAGVPDWVAVEQVEKPGMIAVHLVNCKLGDVRYAVAVEVASGRPVRAVRALSPDRAEALALEFQQQDGRCRFVIPRLGVYEVAVLELEP